MEFEIVFYKDAKNCNPIEEFIIKLGKSNRALAAKTTQGIKKLRDRSYHREPLSKHLESGLWELRVKTGSDILRIIYTFNKGRIILLLHIFIKKKQKTPLNELEIARKRLKEIKTKEGN
jgi:phage-related protein